MSYRKLAEGAVELIQDYIQANLPAALDLVSQNATSAPQMSLEDIKSYFVYPKAIGYVPPICFIIVDEIDFKIRENKSNFVNAVDKITVSVVVEDQDENILTYKAYRYQSALHSVLDEATMVSSDNKLQLQCVVYRAGFSKTYMNEEGPGGFRKEVVLQCEVTHTENF